MRKQLKKIFASRRKMLKYYAKGAKGSVSRSYWLGRLDELKRIKQMVGGMTYTEIRLDIEHARW